MLASPARTHAVLARGIEGALAKGEVAEGRGVRNWALAERVRGTSACVQVCVVRVCNLEALRRARPATELDGRLRRLVVPLPGRRKNFARVLEAELGAMVARGATQGRDSIEYWLLPGAAYLGFRSNFWVFERGATRSLTEAHEASFAR
jgi:hypothetical protein